MKSRRPLAPVLVGLALLGAAALLLMPRSDADTANDPGARRAAALAAARTVRVAPVVATTDGREITLSGTVRAKRRTEASFSIGGRLEARPVDVGTRVAAGQVLARIDGRAWAHEAARAEAAVAELEIRVAQARRDLARVTKLFEARAATAEEREQVEASERAVASARDAAAAVAAEARRLVEETVLRAPFAGTVRDVRLEPGEYAEPGAAVVVLDGDGAVEIEVEVPEWAAGRIREGARVPIALPAAPEIRLEGTVTEVGRTAAGAGRLFPVVVRCPPDAPVAAGATAEVTLSIEGEPALAVPLRAVLNPGGRDAAVFRVQGDTARRVRVEPDRIRGELVSVRGELGAGDLVVVAGQASLGDGDTVTILD